MIASSRSLVIFANAPEKGRVKSRIAADLGPDVALIAYRTLAEHAVAMAKAAEPALSLDVPLDVEVGWGAHWGEAH